jgi:erythronate-4-phosphate dehydrogenase
MRSCPYKLLIITQPAGVPKEFKIIIFTNKKSGMIKIVADDKIPYLRGVLESFANISYLPGRQITREVVRDADALLIRTRTRCNSDLLEGSSVKFIGTGTIGFDHIDTDYCRSRNILWTNAPGCNSSSVMQYIAAALLRISSETGTSLRGRTLGIVGVGNVGSKVEKLARLMGMNILLNDPPRARREGESRFVSLERILSESDIITLHVPLNKDGEDRTLHLFDSSVMEKVKKGCWLINTSRGEVTENDALMGALAGERLSGAVLDVWENEPEINIPLMHMAFLATPHIAGYSADGKANGTAMIIRSFSDTFGMTLGDWYPAEVAPPENPVLAIDCEGKNTEEIIRRAVFHTYNIVEDDVKLRFDPSRFENLRENYPLRREFGSYSLKLKDCPVDAWSILKELGFRIL